MSVFKWTANAYMPKDIGAYEAFGSWIYGKKEGVHGGETTAYLDGLMAYGAANPGHRHPAIVQAAIDQLKKLPLISMAIGNPLVEPFSEALCRLAGPGNEGWKNGKVLPMNTGAEGVETAMKVARKWGRVHRGIPDGDQRIIFCKGNFHGRTITIVSASNDRDAYEGFGPKTPGIDLVPYNDLEAMRKMISDSTCAILVEPIQGESGVVVPDEGYLTGLRKLADEYGILLIFDEIQSGFGRSGKMFSWHHEGLDAEPDLLITGKALGGGIFPISAVVSRDKSIFDDGVITPGTHGSTFFGNPVACATALASMNVHVDEDLPEKSRKLGAEMKVALRGICEKCSFMTGIRGKGLWFGIILDVHGISADTLSAALAFAPKSCGTPLISKAAQAHVLRLSPSLNMSSKEASQMIDRIDRTCAFLEENPTWSYDH